MSKVECSMVEILVLELLNVLNNAGKYLYLYLEELSLVSCCLWLLVCEGEVNYVLFKYPKHCPRL